MEALSILRDERINAHNVLFSMTVGEYLTRLERCETRTLSKDVGSPPQKPFTHC